MSHTDAIRPGARIAAPGFFRVKGVFTLRHVVFMGVLLAFTTILASPALTIYITPTFKAISFSYLPGLLAACMFGPWAGIVYGFAADTLGFLANPQGGYFPGFAISEMVTYFIYALLLYKQKITLPRIIISRAIILVIVYLGLNFIWLSLMYGETGGGFYTGARLINNLVQFPFHVFIIWAILKQLKRIRFLSDEWMQ